MVSVIAATVAVLFAVMGLVAIAVPERVVGIFGGTAATVDARNEVRAVYGGFGIAIAAVLVTVPADLRAGVLLAVAVALAGMAGGRVVGFVLERPRRLFPTVVFCVIEAAGAAALLTACAAAAG